VRPRSAKASSSCASRWEHRSGPRRRYADPVQSSIARLQSHAAGAQYPFVQLHQSQVQAPQESPGKQQT
jgi:hypothetical protein